MTKQELSEYAEELEGVIEEAFAALEDDDADQAKAVLAEYVEEADEADQNSK